MTAIVSAYAGSTGLRRRCVFCGLLVGMIVWIDGEREYERYVETDDGPVCGDCHDDPLAKERAGRAAIRSERKAAHNKQCRLIDGRSLTQEERAARDEVIATLHAEGKCRAEIGERVGLTVRGVGHVLKAIR